MTKVTEGEISHGVQDVGKYYLNFPILAKGFVRQDSVHDFVNSDSDGDFIALSGSKSEVITLELSSKFMVVDPFPYFVAIYDSNAAETRPLDVLANKVDLVAIYDSCDVLEAQHLALDPAYTAVCSVSVPPPRLTAVKRAPKQVANGNLLLGSLNTYGSLSLINKSAEYNRWNPLEGLNIAETLRDTLLPEVDIGKIKDFKSYQEYINPAWITMFAWLPDNADTTGQHVLVLGTASGSLWLLTLSADAKTLLSHQETKTSMGRICHIQAFKDLLLVGDSKGLIHLYQLSAKGNTALALVKPLWEKTDRMGLQMAVITECPRTDCYYITCCKAAHLLTWSMPRTGNADCLQARIYVGGMKITALCSLDNTSYAAGTAGSCLHCVQIIHENNQLSLQTQSIAMSVLQDFQVMGLCTSRHKNLMTLFLYRNKEYLNETVSQKNQLVMQVLKVGNQDPLEQLIRHLKSNKPMNHYTDLLAALRLHVFAEENWQKYMDFGPLDSFEFANSATEDQLKQLQIKFHVLQNVIRLQSSHLQLTVHIQKSRDELQLLLAMLNITHIRLRFQFIGSLSKRTPFQEQAIKCMFEEAHRLINKLKADFTENHVQGSTAKAFVEQMDNHIQNLHEMLGIPVIAYPQKQHHRCSVSFVEISLSLDRRYCSLCDRQVLFELDNLRELYESGRNLACPVCHGSFATEMFDA
ncbi:uncharacterized protein LOC117139181 [Drosophila mauritiana]|uniref:Uncharacterized protein LOC117139181 n=1 Tax=Drosophila mauritiana TaxID=7226 RepID=A0A6P8K3Y9_DROMA|nr:uncharacterized protein LOC117139181 [Drosophila mauritiana]